MRILYLHGFLGGPQDMEPLFLKDHDCDALDLRGYLNRSNWEEALFQVLSQYDVLVGYSFGGRLIAKVGLSFDLSLKTWVCISSRHTPILKPEQEVRREVAMKWRLFLEKKKNIREFCSLWEDQKLFSGHSMKAYRRNHSIKVVDWTLLEVLTYFQRFFTFSEELKLGAQSVYIYGENDLKYASYAPLLKAQGAQVKQAHGLGHRLCFESPELIKKILKEICDG